MLNRIDIPFRKFRTGCREYIARHDRARHAYNPRYARKIAMTKNETLFQVLLRQPWWVSFAVATVVYIITQFIFPPVALFVAFPFMALSVYIRYKQATGAAPVNVPEKLAALRDLSWDEFSTRLTRGYEKLGYTVAPSKDSDVDFTLTKEGRVTLLQCRRWKAGETGVGPIRALDAAMKKAEAWSGVSVSATSFTSAAREYAAGRPIELLEHAELIKVLAGVRS